MSRVAKKPVPVPQGVTATLAADVVTIKGAKGSLSVPLQRGVSVVEKDKELQVSYTDGEGVRAMAGATRAHLANMITGVTEGYERKLELVGVGFRAAVQGKALNLTLGFSPPVVFAIPKESRSSPDTDRSAHQGIDRQKVGQLPRRSAASVRRSPTRARV